MVQVFGLFQKVTEVESPSPFTPAFALSTRPLRAPRVPGRVRRLGPFTPGRVLTGDGRLLAGVRCFGPGHAWTAARLRRASWFRGAVSARLLAQSLGGRFRVTSTSRPPIFPRGCATLRPRRCRACVPAAPHPRRLCRGYGWFVFLIVATRTCAAGLRPGFSCPCRPFLVKGRVFCLFPIVGYLFPFDRVSGSLRLLDTSPSGERGLVFPRRLWCIFSFS